MCSCTSSTSNMQVHQFNMLEKLSNECYRMVSLSCRLGYLKLALVILNFSFNILNKASNLEITFSYPHIFKLSVHVKLWMLKEGLVVIRVMFLAFETAM